MSADQPQRCNRCDGSGKVESRFWDEALGEHDFVQINCPACDGAGRRYWHEDQARIDYLENRYDALHGDG